MKNLKTFFREKQQTIISATWLTLFVIFLLFMLHGSQKAFVENFGKAKIETK